MEHNQNGGDPHQEVAPHASDAALEASVAYDTAHAMDTFHMTVELAAVGIGHLDPTGRFLYANPALCRLTGYAREELLGLTFQDIIHSDNAAESLPHLRRLLSGETGETLTCRLKQRRRRSDKPAVWAHVTLTLSPDASRYLIATIEDISERKQLEERLLAASQQLTLAAQDSQRQASDLAATIDAMTDLVVVFDALGRVRLGNKAVSDFMGVHLTLEAGRGYLDLRDTQDRPVPPEQWVSTRVLRGETLTGAQAVDMLANAPDGRKILFNVNGAPVRDAQGLITGGVLVLRDVTERRQLERRTQEALQALLQMAQALVALTPETTPVAPAGASAAGVAPALNPVAQRLAELAGRVLGCSRVGIVALEADGATMHPIAVTGLAPEQAAAWIAGLDGRSMPAFIGTDRMRKLRAGETVELDLSQQPLRSVAHGGPVALAAPLRIGDQLVGALALGYEQEPHAYTGDEIALALALGQLAALVIERDRLLREREESHANALALEQANRRMNEFLGIAAHELRTPLTTLLGTVHLLERRFARMSLADLTREELANQLQMVSRLLAPMDQQGRRLSRIVSDLVDTSRIRAGQLELRMRPCDLAAIVREAVEEQRLAHPLRTIDLALREGAQAPVVGDADRLGQVVTNYLTNALKYSREDRPVEVRLRADSGAARADSGAARVDVRDSGPGLPPEEQSRVWELFHHAPGVTVQSGSGIGLGMGLYFCKTVIERHGGRVGVESAIGQGSTFWFSLPLAADANASAASSP